MFVGFVLFSCAAVKAQQTTTTTTSPTTTPTTITSTNPRVVVTDNLAKPTTSAASQTTPKTSTTKIGNYNVNVSEGVTAQAQTQQSGKFLTVTKWDGSKWVTKREWVPTNGPAAKPNPQ